MSAGGPDSASSAACFILFSSRRCLPVFLFPRRVFFHGVPLSDTATSSLGSAGRGAASASPKELGIYPHEAERERGREGIE